MRAFARLSAGTGAIDEADAGTMRSPAGRATASGRRARAASAPGRPAASSREVLEVAGDQDASGRRGHRQEWFVVGVGQWLRAGRGGRHQERELVDRRQKVLDVARAEPELGAPEDFLVLLADRHVERELQLPGKNRLDDPCRRPGRREEPGDEHVRVEDDPHPRGGTRVVRPRRARAMMVSISEVESRPGPRSRFSRRIARSASSPRARRSVSRVSSTLPASTGMSTATGRPLAVSIASRSRLRASRTCFGRVRKSRIVTVFIRPRVAV